MNDRERDEMRIGDRAKFGTRFWIVRLPRGYGVVDRKEGCRMTHISRQIIDRVFNPARTPHRTAC